MSVTSGFFNSLNHDRRYSAKQMSAIFDGIINDGVFANIGVAFAITADTGVTINIGAGKAWFNSAWVYNDASLPKTLEGSEVVLDRIDAIVIEVDHNENVRMGDIKIVKGTPSSDPKRPTMANETNKCQHPLAYIYRKAGSTEITQADITNMVGTSVCPYITGILQVQNIDNIVAQWNAQWNQWYSEKIAETDSDSAELLAEMKSEFEIWFADVKALLDDDVAAALAAEVAELYSKFDDLAFDGAVYDTIEDSSFDRILGSDGTPIQGKILISGDDGSVGTSQLANGSVTFTKLSRNAKSLVFEDITVPDWAWSPSDDFSNYPIRAAIALPDSGVDASYFVNVLFDEASRIMADLSIDAMSYDGGFYIYAADYPEVLVKINAVECTPTLANVIRSNVFGVINVIYAAGKTVTCTDGTTTLTAKTTSGSWQFGVPNAGEWVISDGTSSQIANITTQGQTVSVELFSGVYLFKNGNQYTDLTGGWSDSGWSINVNGGTSGTASVGETINVASPTGTVWHGKSVGTQKKIDLSPFSRLCVVVDELQVTSNGTLKVSATSDKITESDPALAVLVLEKGVNTLDISGIDTTCYIALNTRASTGSVSASVSEVLLI